MHTNQEILNMSEKFDYEKSQRMYDLLSGFNEIVLVSLLWIITSLPIFTIGVSSSAMYHVVMKSIRKKEGKVISEFLGFFSKNFKRIIIPSVLFVLVLFCLLIGLNISQENSKNSQAWGIAGYVYRLMILFLGMLGSMVFPTFTHSEDSGLKVMYTGAKLTVIHLFTSFTLALMILLVVIINSWMFVLLLITPALTTLIASMVLETYLIDEIESGHIGEKEIIHEHV